MSSRLHDVPVRTDWTWPMINEPVYGFKRYAPARNEIPAHVLATSPVALHHSPRELPLDLIQRIISYIQDVADVARITRTSRLFYYMALPRLYERMTLKSYSELRYVDGQPEGYGGGSPFSMGLLGLVTRNVAGYVKHWKVTGEWRERDVEEILKGRVPDNSMMLMISLRAAMDRMALLQSFWWDMNAKPMSTLFAGLALRPTLTSLRIKSPTQRVIRPTTTVPPIPSLKELWLTDIDPLCYPDDFSVLLLHSRKLEKLNLHWNPRMREQGEPSINLHSLFGRCIATGHKMSIKELGLMNMYIPNHGELIEALREEELREVAFINCVDTKNPMTVFFDQTWLKPANDNVPGNIKIMRGEGLDRGHAHLLRRTEGMEEFYIINKRDFDRRKSPSVTSKSVSVDNSPADTTNGSTARPPFTPTEYISLAADYLASLTERHGATLRVLLLTEQWKLSQPTLINLLESLPNIEQIGLAIDDMSLTRLRQVIPRAPKLWVFRLLHTNAEALWAVHEENDHIFGWKIEFARSEYRNLKVLGVGNRAYNLGSVVDEPYIDEERGVHEPRTRIITRMSEEDTKQIKLFRMDTMELL